MNIDVPDLQFKEIADPAVTSILNKIGNALALIYKSVSKPIILPKVFPIKGDVDARIDSLPPIKITNLNELERYFNTIAQQISGLTRAISLMPSPKIEMPKMDMPKYTPQDNTAVVEALQGLQEAIAGISKREISFPSTISVDNFPRQLTPQPVTHISINALQGYIKTTAATVGTTLTTLPSYGQLLNRRAVQVYNNSATTIYIGGSDVTTSNGIPVPASAYSPILDAGYNVILYGIAASGGLNVRVLEVSDEASGR